jgi:sensor domain CHASE-containing protein
METLVTVLITLGVCAIAYGVLGVVRLNRKAEELDTLKLDLVDVEDRLEKQLETEIQERIKLMETLSREIDMSTKDCRDRIEGWVGSTDRRFDKAYNQIRELDRVVNPNKDMLKK